MTDQTQPTGSPATGFPPYGKVRVAVGIADNFSVSIDPDMGIVEFDTKPTDHGYHVITARAYLNRAEVAHLQSILTVWLEDPTMFAARPDGATDAE